MPGVGSPGALLHLPRAQSYSILMRMGQGDLAICDWDLGLSEAALLGRTP